MKRVCYAEGQVQMTGLLPGSRRRRETSLETIVGNNSCRPELEIYTSLILRAPTKTIYPVLK